MNGAQYPLNSRLYGSQCGSGRLEEKIFVPTRIWSLDYPAGRRESTLTMLHWPPKFYPRTGHEDLALAALSNGEKNPFPTVQETGWAPGTVLFDAEYPMPTMGFKPQSESQ